MANHVLQFLQYGAPAKAVAELGAECTAPFLPSLALAAADSPALIPALLPSLRSHLQVPKALAYANLDYVEIAHLVLEEEAAANKSGSLPPMDEDGEEDEDKKKAWKWDEDELEDEDADECYSFEVADEKERVKIAILSVRKRAQQFNFKGGPQLLEKEEGSIWSNEAYLTELLCLLPIAASRCPALLTPEQLVKGLISASNCCALLVTTFANNPSEAERGALALASVLGRHRDGSDNVPGSPHASESTTSAAKTGSGPGIASLYSQHSGVHAQEQTPPSSSPYAHAVIQTLSSFYHVSPKYASTCRDALVKTSTLPEMALQITLDIFHDELQFLSKLIFCKERSSQWILSVFGCSQKHGESQHTAAAPHPPHGKEKDAGSDHKSNSASHPSGKGVAQRVRDALLADARSTWEKQGLCGRLHAHLRLYCVLIRTCDLPPGHEEVEFWMGVLGGTKEVTTNKEGEYPSKNKFVSERTLELGISFICLIPGLSGSATKAMLHKTVENLLRAAMGNAPYSDCTPEIELAVWVAVQLLQRRFPDIAVFVREALGVQVAVHNASMRDLADAAVAAGIVSDPYTAASAAAALRPKAPIPSPKKRPLYSWKCLEQLLQSTTFARCAIDISESVMHYMSVAAEPIHSTFPPIIQGYTELSVSAPRARAGLQRFRMRPLSRDALVRALAPGVAILRDREFVANLSQSGRLLRSSSKSWEGDGPVKAKEIGEHLATTALVSYYILCRESISRSMGIDGGSNQGLSSAELDTSEDDGWWLDLLYGLPLRELFMYMETNWPAYENLFPQWLGVASVVFPEKFTAQALLQDIEKTSTACETHIDNVPCTEDLRWVGPVELPSDSPDDAKPNVTEPELDTLRPENDISAMDVDGQKCEEIFASDSLASGARGSRFSREVIVDAMMVAIGNPLPAMRVLRAFSRRAHPGRIGESAEQLETFVGIGVEWPLEIAMMKELVPQLLDSSCPRCLQDQFCVWWRSLPSSALERLVPVLLNLLGVPSMSKQGDRPRHSYGKLSGKRTEPASKRLSTTGLVEEPLKLIACNPKVFRSPLLGIVLDLLLEILVANRRICQVAASDGGRDGLKREEVAAAVIAQDSAVCQILLEGCLPNSELGDAEQPGPLLEARRLVLATICSLIHRSPLLLKLLHFQGYDQRLIPVILEGVPAMVQCLDFVGELIQQCQQHRQVFAVILTGHVTSVYPNLPQSLTVAQQVVQHVTQVRSKIASCAGFLQEVLGFQISGPEQASAWETATISGLAYVISVSTALVRWKSLCISISSCY
ncbi:hypothetical protein R1sor_014618 [Riccia sorocarpa]|uniref:Uncharacterized protein n=1 Tax=Riccia sorocarpa TaxID=122646 RepID=A0ABD3HG09_9MARC